MGYTYYSRERLDEPGHDGLIRYDGSTIEYARDGAWVEKPDLIRHVFAPGADSPVVITRAVARELAPRHGVSVDGA